MAARQKCNYHCWWKNWAGWDTVTAMPGSRMLERTQTPNELVRHIKSNHTGLAEPVNLPPLWLPMLGLRLC
jgi:hypothetical protein